MLTDRDCVCLKGQCEYFLGIILNINNLDTYNIQVLYLKYKYIPDFKSYRHGSHFIGLWEDPLIDCLNSPFI